MQNASEERRNAKIHTLSPQCNSSTMEELCRFDPGKRTPTTRPAHDLLCTLSIAPLRLHLLPLDPRQWRLPPWEDGGEARACPWRTATARCTDLDFIKSLVRWDSWDLCAPLTHLPGRHPLLAACPRARRDLTSCDAHVTRHNANAIFVGYGDCSIPYA
jgi:hypothetical protein